MSCHGVPSCVGGSSPLDSEREECRFPCRRVRPTQLSLLSVQALDGRYALESSSQRTIEAVRPVYQHMLIRVSGRALDDFHWRNSVVKPEAAQNPHNSFTGRTLFFAVVKDAYAWIAKYRTHIFDGDFADIVKHPLIDSISCKCRDKTSHSRFRPPIVRHFDLQSVVRELHAV
jgi:hypothetical protein